jgi:hypothetical protein
MNNQEEFKEFIRIETLDYLVGINLHKVMDRHCACIRRKLLIQCQDTTITRLWGGSY